MSRSAMCAILLVLGGGSALAQGGPGMMGPQRGGAPTVAGPCATDHVKFCKNVQPGNGRIFDCLAGHQAQLTPMCKKRLEPLLKKRGQYKA